MKSILTTSTTAASATTSSHRHHPSKQNQLAQLPCFAAIDLAEPTSVLNLRWSPSPTSTTTTIQSPPFAVSGSFISSGREDSDGLVAVAAASDLEDTKLQWAREPTGILQPGFSSPAEDLDSMLMAAASPPQETSFVRWIFGEKEDAATMQPLLFQQMPSRDDAVISDPNITPFNLADGNSLLFSDGAVSYPSLLPPLYDSSAAESILDEHLYLKQMQPPSELGPAPMARFIRPKPSAAPLDALGAIDQLVEAAGFVDSGDLALAQAILARLNQIVSPSGSPLHRSAFYFKEALLLLLSGFSHHHEIPLLSAVDLVHKIGAYKSFSEISPIPQFANFTANQALLEALEGVDSIHIIDFDIGLGGQWASFMQELALNPRGCTPALRVTAVVPSDSMELRLTGDNLSHFAQELNVPFRFGAVDFRQFESLCLDALALSRGESVAVSFSPAIRRELSRSDSLPGFLRFLKRLGPRIVVFVDADCDSGGAEGGLDSSIRRQFVARLEFYFSLMDSLDATGLDRETVRRIEQFLLQPRINSAVSALCRPSVGRKMPWQTLFGRAGLTPVHFSNFTETQADYLLRRNHVKGFHVEKRHSSLLLCWQHRELLSTSAWRCC